MPEIIFLLGDATEARNDNHIRLPKGFRDAGWQVTELNHDCVRLQAGALRFGEEDPARELLPVLAFVELTLHGAPKFRICQIEIGDCGASHGAVL